ACVGAVPFQHREFRQMQVAALAVAKHTRELEDFLLAGGQELLAGEFRRGAQISAHAAAIGAHELGAWCMQMSFVAGRDLQDAGLDLKESLLVEKSADGAHDFPARQQKRLAIDMPRRRPPGRWLVVPGHQLTPPAARMRSLK